MAAAPNAGFVFSPPVPVLEQLGIAHSSSPHLGRRMSGVVYLSAVYGKENRLGFLMSHNEGDTFMRPIPLSNSGSYVMAHGEASPTFALGPTQIYALWQQQTAQGHADLLVARSLTYGRNFEKPVKVVSKSTPSFNGFSSIGVAPNGDVYVVWLDGRDPQPPVPDSLDPGGTFSVYIARSTDQGASFGENIRIAYGACPCCRPTLAFGADGEVFVAWRKVFPGDIRDIVVAASRDYGKTFTQPVRIATDNWKLSGCPDSGPSLAVDGRRLYVAWMTEGGNKSKVEMVYSDDGAKTFTKAITASGNVLDPNHPALSVAEGGTLLLAFQGRDPEKDKGWGPLRVYLVEYGKSGITQPYELPGNQGSASYPQVLAGGSGRVYMAWTETTDGGSRVVLARGRRE